MCNAHYHQRCQQLCQSIACSRQQDLRFNIDCHKEHGVSIMLSFDEDCAKHNKPRKIDTKDLPKTAPSRIQDGHTLQTWREARHYSMLLNQSIIECLEKDEYLKRLVEFLDQSITSQEHRVHWNEIGKEKLLSEGPEKLKIRLGRYKRIQVVRMKEVKESKDSSFSSFSMRRKVVEVDEVVDIAVLWQMYVDPEARSISTPYVDPKSRKARSRSTPLGIQIARKMISPKLAARKEGKRL